ncbi:MAG: hypothetical protein GX933_05195 [Chloroflexi bacterium]|nr:hypothetical protein [Chloroflexota bacterium]
MKIDVKKVLKNLIDEEEECLRELQSTMEDLLKEWVRYRWKKMAYDSKFPKEKINPYVSDISNTSEVIKNLGDKILYKKAEINVLKGYLQLSEPEIEGKIAYIEKGLSDIDKYF